MTAKKYQRAPRPDAFFALRAAGLLADGKSDQAMELCRQGLIYYPDNPSGYTMLANTYLALGDRERARLVLVDGFRRTGAEPLARLASDLSEHRPIPSLDPPQTEEPVVADHLQPASSMPNEPPLTISGIDLHEEKDVEITERALAGDHNELIPGTEAVTERDGGEIEPDGEDDTKGDGSASERPESRLGIELVVQEGEGREGVLALHMGRHSLRARSSNLRLIPGLEFAPLRHEDSAPRQSIASLMNEPMSELPFRPATPSAGSTPPPLPTIEAMETLPVDAATGEPRLPVSESLSDAISELTDTGVRLPRNPGRMHELAQTEEDLTPLEALARRLETARIPVVEEGEPRAIFEPSIVSDTLANILVQQKAYAEALKAFQTLARMKPEKMDSYQEQIERMKHLLAHHDEEGSEQGEEPGGVE